MTPAKVAYVCEFSRRSVGLRRPAELGGVVHGRCVVTDALCCAEGGRLSSAAVSIAVVNAIW